MPFASCFILRMTVLVLTVFLLGGGALRADLLKNEKFKEGKAPWKGDVQDLPAALGQAAPSGVLIKLKKDKWVRMYQTFKKSSKFLGYTITYQLSTDYKLLFAAKSSVNFPEFRALDAPEDRWLLSLGQNRGWYSDYLKPSADLSAPVTMIGTVPGPDNVGECTIGLAFPPGEGTITFLEFSIVTRDSR